jgi:hypothetical protein
MKIAPDWSNHGDIAVIVDFGPAAVTGGEAPQIDRVLASMRGVLGVCYRQGLATNAQPVGTLRIAAALGRLGDVVRATAERSETVGDETTQCVLQRVRNATFAPPTGSGVRVNFTVSFRRVPRHH